MTKNTSSVATHHFDMLYAKSDDPWDYESGDYERRKYARTLMLLPRRHYPSGFELGCSIGVLTQGLARYCDHILGVDCSAKAIDIANRKHSHPAVEFAQMRAPAELPKGRRFDLIVLSEVLYFFSADDLASVAEFVRASANMGASIMLVNYLGPTKHAASGDDAAEGFLQRAEAFTRVVSQIRDTHFRIDVLERTNAV